MKRIFTLWVVAFFITGFLFTAVPARVNAKSPYLAQVATTVEELKALINALQAQVQALLERVNQVTGGINVAVPVPAPEPSSSTEPGVPPSGVIPSGEVVLEELPGSPRVSCVLPELRIGQKNNAVYLLQMTLAKDRNIYPEGLVTGYFGPLTQAAVKRFQEANGENQTGIVDDATLRKLNAVILQAFPECGDVSIPTPVSRPKPPKYEFFPTSEWWNDFWPEINSLLESNFENVDKIKGARNIKQKYGLTEFGVADAILVYVSKGATTGIYTVVRFDYHTGKPVLALFKQKSGDIKPLTFSEGVGGAGRYGSSVDFKSFGKQGKALYSAEYWLYGDPIDYCIAEVYAWNGNVEIFEFNTDLSNIYQKEYCATAGITIEPPLNQPPVITGVSGPTTLKVGEAGKWTVNAYDPEKGYLRYSVDWGDAALQPLSAQASPVDSQTATFMHSYSRAGTYTATFTVTDVQGLSAKTSLSVKVGDGGISLAPISVYSPASGDTWYKGKTYNIGWKTPLNSQIEFVNIALNTGIYCITAPCPSSRTIAKGVRNSGGGTYNWTIPSDIENSSRYRIEVYDAKNSKNYGISGYFTITEAIQTDLTITSPQKGERWTIGNTYHIKWTYPSELAGKSVRVVVSAAHDGLPSLSKVPIYDSKLGVSYIVPSGGDVLWTLSIEGTGLLEGENIVSLEIHDLQTGKVYNAVSEKFIVSKPVPYLCAERSATQRAPLGTREFENLGLDISSHPEIARYRIQWSSGAWSRWYIPGVDDVDWKTNFNGSLRRVWSYFADHTHEVEICPNMRTN